MQKATIKRLSAAAVGIGVAASIVIAGHASDAEDLASTYPQVGPVPADIERDLADFDISIKPTAATATALARERPAVSLEKATDAARANLGLGPQVVAESATLANVTTGQNGRELEPDPSKPSRIDPAIKDKEVWVITFDNAPMPILGKEGYTGPSVHYGPLVALVDPGTAELLYAISY